MDRSFEHRIEQHLNQFKEDRVFKQLHVMESAQSSTVKMKKYPDPVIVMSSNNYLGLSNEPSIKKEMCEAVECWGVGTASVRFICGTLGLHEILEKETASFLGTQASTTYQTCWNANEAVFQTLFEAGDVVISDAFNHASIIDGLRLMKGADKKVYAHSNMDELENILKQCAHYKTRAIVTDGVFSMEGDIAKLPELIELKHKYNCILIVDESHATGVLGKTGRGTFEHFNCMDEIDILTGTYGKALGGAAGGFIASSQPIVEYCVQRSRPQLFSNALPPAVAQAAISSIRFLKNNPSRVETLKANTLYFRQKAKDLKLNVLEGQTPIVPIIVGETALAIELSQKLLERGVFVTGFGFPVVPQGHARLRIQISAGHSKEQLDRVLEQLAELLT